MTPIDELARLLRPAGTGLCLVSTGQHAQRRVHEARHGVRGQGELGLVAADRVALAPPLSGPDETARTLALPARASIDAILSPPAPGSLRARRLTSAMP